MQTRPSIVMLMCAALAACGAARPREPEVPSSPDAADDADARAEVWAPTPARIQPEAPAVRPVRTLTTLIEVRDRKGRIKRFQVVAESEMSLAQAETYDMDGPFKSQLDQRFAQVVDGALKALLGQADVPLVNDWLDRTERIAYAPPVGPAGAMNPDTVLEWELRVRLEHEYDEGKQVRQALDGVIVRGVGLNARTTVEKRAPGERQLGAFSP